MRDRTFQGVTRGVTDRDTTPLGVSRVTATPPTVTCHGLVVTPIGMKHHPDCLFWWDGYRSECTCGLTVPCPDWSALTPITVEQWNEWAARITTQPITEDVT